MDIIITRLHEGVSELAINAVVLKINYQPDTGHVKIYGQEVVAEKAVLLIGNVKVQGVNPDVDVQSVDPDQGVNPDVDFQGVDPDPGENPDVDVQSVDPDPGTNPDLDVQSVDSYSNCFRVSSIQYGTSRFFHECNCIFSK